MKARSGAAMLLIAFAAGLAGMPAEAHGRHHRYRETIRTLHIHRSHFHYAIRSRRFVDPVAVAASTQPPALAVRCAYPLYGDPYPPSGFLSPCTEYTPPPGRDRILHRAVYWTGVHYFAEFPGRTEAGFFPKPVVRHIHRIVRHAVVLHARY